MKDFNIKVNETEAKVLTQQLIQIASTNPPGEVDECAIFIRNWLNKNNVPAEIIKSNHVANVVAKLGKNNGKKLLWNGHFDVVPAGSNWTVDPFSGTYKDGFVYGRGASDMKSGVAAMMLALREIKKENIKINGQIEFWGIGDEETGSKNGTKMLLDTLGNHYDGAVVSEPTDFYVERAQRGLRWLEIKILGQASHASRPHIGKNAVEYAMKVTEALKSIEYDTYNEIFEDKLEKPTLSVTMINGGRQTNVIPEECTLTIDRRMLPGETEEKVMSEIEKALESIKEDRITATVKVTNKGWDPFITDEKEDVVQSIMKSYEVICDETPRVRGKGGCTDASHIFHAGIPVVIFGPGASNESHTADEKVSVERVARTAEIFIHSAIHFLK